MHRVALTMHFQMANFINQWIDQTIKAGAVVDITKPIQQWDDYTLAIQASYHIQQCKSALLNLQTLEIWPEYSSELFNQTTVSSDLEYHEKELDLLILEIKRRHIP
jgi:hypothetical protein